MREIKFRARGQVGRKIWYYGLLTSLGENVCHVKDENIMHEYICDTDTLGQYTGVKDKKGKEIYEGDIVKAIVEGSLSEIICKVIYMNGAFCQDIGDPIYYPIIWNNTSTEVIGNIYNNPDLLGRIGKEEQ